MRNTILGQSHLKLGDTYYPLESTVHISHIAQHAVAGERHAFLFEKTEVRRQKTECAERSCHAETAETTETRETRENPPSFRAQRSGVEKSFHTEALRREKKSHTDYTDFHRNSSSTTNYARKQADCTEPDGEETGTNAIPICGMARFSEHKMWKENLRQSTESARDD